jgi:8-oxo-dGTP diphosphatase
VEPTRIACVGALVTDERGRLLLVRRGTDPGKGLWSVPGGRVEPGESAVEAVVRELREETGLLVEPTGVAGVVERAAPGGRVFQIEDFHARLADGAAPEEARAGDDAAEVGWFSSADLDRLDCVEGLVDQLRSWRVIPPRDPASSCQAEE